MVFYSEWDIQVHVANHMLGRIFFFFLTSAYYGCTSTQTEAQTQSCLDMFFSFFATFSFFNHNVLWINSDKPLCLILILQEMFHLTIATIISSFNSH